MADEHIQLRSYREVFRLTEGRRMYTFGELRIADVIPGGLPLRAVGYFLAAVILVFIASHLPLLGALLGELPWQLRYFILPGMCAALGVVVAPDGRMPHRFAADWLRFHARRRRRVAGEPVPHEGERRHVGGELAAVPDATWPELRRATVRGPALVELPYTMAISRRRGGRLLARKPGPGRARGCAEVASVDLQPGERLEVRP